MLPDGPDDDHARSAQIADRNPSYGCGGILNPWHCDKRFVSRRDRSYRDAPTARTGILRKYAVDRFERSMLRTSLNSLNRPGSLPP